MLILQALHLGRIIHIPVDPDALVLDGFRFVSVMKAKTVCLVDNIAASAGALTFQNTVFASVLRLVDDIPASTYQARVVATPPDFEVCAVILAASNLQFVKVSI